jgi:hypothetical protein
MKMWNTLLMTTRWMISAYHQNLDGTLGMPTFEDSIDHQTSEKGDSGKMTQQ